MRSIFAMKMKIFDKKMDKQNEKHILNDLLGNH